MSKVDRGFSAPRLFALLLAAALPESVSPAAAEEAPRPPITALAFAPEGDRLVLGSQAGLEVLHWPKLELDRRLPTRLVNVHDLAFSPNGELLAAAGGKPGVRGACELVRWPSGEELQRWDAHADCFYAAAWNQAGGAIALGDLTGKVTLYRIGREQPSGEFGGHSRGVMALAWQPEGERLLSGGLEGTLRYWDMEEGKPIRVFENHTGAALGLAWRPPHEGELPMAVSIGEDRTVRWWQPTIGRLVRFTRLPSVPQAVVWSPDGERVAVACRDGALRLLNPASAEVTAVLPGVEGTAYALAVAPGGGIVVAGERGEVRRVEFPQGWP